jgi:hypothetical protein
LTCNLHLFLQLLRRDASAEVGHFRKQTKIKRGKTLVACVFLPPEDSPLRSGWSMAVGRYHKTLASESILDYCFLAAVNIASMLVMEGMMLHQLAGGKVRKHHRHCITCMTKSLIFAPVGAIHIEPSAT